MVRIGCWASARAESMPTPAITNGPQLCSISSATQAIYAAIVVAALKSICAIINPAYGDALLHLAALA